MHDLAKWARNPWNLSLAELRCERVQGCNFERRLDLIDGLAMLGLGNSKAIPSKGAETILICGSLNV